MEGGCIRLVMTPVTEATLSLLAGSESNSGLWACDIFLTQVQNTSPPLGIEKTLLCSYDLRRWATSIVQDDTPFCCNQKTGTLHIFISNLPVSITVLQLVQFLQDKHSFGVKKACIDPMQPGYAYNTAHVELVTSHHAGKLLQLAFCKGLVYDKHALVY